MLNTVVKAGDNDRVERVGLTNQNGELRIVSLNILILVLDEVANTSRVVRGAAEKETKLLNTLSRKVLPNTNCNAHYILSKIKRRYHIIRDENYKDIHIIGIFRQ